ncbi:MAG TPA: SRPBCC family protein [Pseudolabrys sp.]|jgi:coenzyme Q-binding protein COQ10|nr:SRPBCC family protein [Pseudolabrys sp.]HEX2538281.1 SRPBCC family protein [Pseudolabrys sp.]
MPQFSTRRRVRHAAGDMFDLVADIERYPEFVPLCAGMRVKSRAGKDEGVCVIVAVMTVAYKLIHQSFTSRVTLDRARLTILVEYLDGPFSRMQNRWTFRQTSETSSDVEFFIDYEFRSRTFAMLAGAVFDTVFRRMAAAFEKRADQVYGRKLA